MAITAESSQRFLRPSDVGRIRRNQRRIQASRVLSIAFNVLVVAAVVLVATWLYRRTQSDARFAVRAIEVAGIQHTSRAAVNAITSRYVGLNLFKMDINLVRHDLGGLPWVKRIEVEKNLPDTLRILVVERTPVALIRQGAAFSYVDEEGVAITPLSAAVGDPDLPLVTDASGPELVRTVAMIHALKASDPDLYSRISEVRPIAPDGFALFDRQLGAFVLANSDGLRDKWRTLYSLVASEHLEKGSVEYADLRFADRIVMKPSRPLHSESTAAQRAKAVTEITN